MRYKRTSSSLTWLKHWKSLHLGLVIDRPEHMTIMKHLRINEKNHLNQLDQLQKDANNIKDTMLGACQAT